MMMTSTVVLSMKDVRQQVLEPWCGVCDAPAIDGVCHPGHIGTIQSPPLFTRCPGCQPKGLVPAHDGKGGKGFTMDGRWIEPAHAIDLILMSTARDATATFQVMSSKITTHDRAIVIHFNITTAVMCGEFEDAVKWRHRLKDLEEQI